MYKKIMVPVAFDEDIDAKSGPALEAAQALAAPGASITVMHVIERVPGYATAYLSKDYIAQTRADLLSRLEALAASVPGGKAVVVDGHSGRTILDHAQKEGFDLIVIASHQPGMQDYLLGSTASQVVRHARCAVHVIR